MRGKSKNPGHTVCRVIETDGRVVVQTTPRRAEAILLVLSGATLEEVGQQFGITRERVRQYLRDAGIRTKQRTLVRPQPTVQRRWQRYGKRKGVPPLSRAIRRQRVARVIEVIKRLGLRGGKSPTMRAVAEEVFGRVCGTSAAMRLAIFCGPRRGRRIVRRLHVIWRMAGYEVRGLGTGERTERTRAAARINVRKALAARWKAA